jgi:hypothetical protein
MHNYSAASVPRQIPRESYLVKYDKETTAQNDVDSEIVNIAVSFARFKPAEFVIVQLQQIAGQIHSAQPREHGGIRHGRCHEHLLFWAARPRRPGRAAFVGLEENGGDFASSGLLGEAALAGT